MDSELTSSCGACGPAVRPGPCQFELLYDEALCQVESLQRQVRHLRAETRRKDEENRALAARTGTETPTPQGSRSATPTPQRSATPTQDEHPMERGHDPPRSLTPVEHPGVAEERERHARDKQEAKEKHGREVQRLQAEFSKERQWWKKEVQSRDVQIRTLNTRIAQQTKIQRTEKCVQTSPTNAPLTSEVRPSVTKTSGESGSKASQEPSTQTISDEMEGIYESLFGCETSDTDEKVITSECSTVIPKSGNSDSSTVRPQCVNPDSSLDVENSLAIASSSHKGLSKGFRIPKKNTSSSVAISVSENTKVETVHAKCNPDKDTLQSARQVDVVNAQTSNNSKIEHDANPKDSNHGVALRDRKTSECREKSNREGKESETTREQRDQSQQRGRERKTSLCERRIKEEPPLKSAEKEETPIDKNKSSHPKLDKTKIISPKDKEPSATKEGTLSQCEKPTQKKSNNTNTVPSTTDQCQTKPSSNERGKQLDSISKTENKPERTKKTDESKKSSASSGKSSSQELSSTVASKLQSLANTTSTHNLSSKTNVFKDNAERSTSRKRKYSIQEESYVIEDTLINDKPQKRSKAGEKRSEEQSRRTPSHQDTRNSSKSEITRKKKNDKSLGLSDFERVKAYTDMARKQGREKKECTSQSCNLKPEDTKTDSKNRAPNEIPLLGEQVGEIKECAGQNQSSSLNFEDTQKKSKDATPVDIPLLGTNSGIASTSYEWLRDCKPKSDQQQINTQHGCSPSSKANVSGLVPTTQNYTPDPNTNKKFAYEGLGRSRQAVKSSPHNISHCTQQSTVMKVKHEEYDPYKPNVCPGYKASDKLESYSTKLQSYSTKKGASKSKSQNSTYHNSGLTASNVVQHSSLESMKGASSQQSVQFSNNATMPPSQLSTHTTGANILKIDDLISQVNISQIPATVFGEVEKLLKSVHPTDKVETPVSKNDNTDAKVIDAQPPKRIEVPLPSPLKRPPSERLRSPLNIPAPMAKLSGESPKSDSLQNEMRYADIAVKKGQIRRKRKGDDSSQVKGILKKIKTEDSKQNSTEVTKDFDDNVKAKTFVNEACPTSSSMASSTPVIAEELKSDMPKSSRMKDVVDVKVPAMADHSSSETNLETSHPSWSKSKSDYVTVSEKQHSGSTVDSQSKRTRNSTQSVLHHGEHGLDVKTESVTNLECNQVVKDSHTDLVCSGKSSQSIKELKPKESTVQTYVKEKETRGIEEKTEKSFVGKEKSEQENPPQTSITALPTSPKSPMLEKPSIKSDSNLQFKADKTSTFTEQNTLQASPIQHTSNLEDTSALSEKSGGPDAKNRCDRNNSQLCNESLFDVALDIDVRDCKTDECSPSDASLMLYDEPACSETSDIDNTSFSDVHTKPSADKTPVTPLHEPNVDDSHVSPDMVSAGSDPAVASAVTSLDKEMSTDQRCKNSVIDAEQLDKECVHAEQMEKDVDAEQLHNNIINGDKDIVDAGHMDEDIIDAKQLDEDKIQEIDKISETVCEQSNLVKDQDNCQHDTLNMDIQTDVPCDQTEQDDIANADVKLDDKGKEEKLDSPIDLSDEDPSNNKTDDQSNLSSSQSSNESINSSDISVSVSTDESSDESSEDESSSEESNDSESDTDSDSSSSSNDSNIPSNTSASHDNQLEQGPDEHQQEDDDDKPTGDSTHTEPNPSSQSDSIDDVFLPDDKRPSDVKIDKTITKTDGLDTKKAHNKSQHTSNVDLQERSVHPNASEGADNSQKDGHNKPTRDFNKTEPYSSPQSDSKKCSSEIKVDCEVLEASDKTPTKADDLDAQSNMDQDKSPHKSNMDLKEENINSNASSKSKGQPNNNLPSEDGTNVDEANFNDVVLDLHPTMDYDLDISNMSSNLSTNYAKNVNSSPKKSFDLKQSFKSPDCEDGEILSDNDKKNTSVKSSPRKREKSTSRRSTVRQSSRKENRKGHSLSHSTARSSRDSVSSSRNISRKRVSRSPNIDKHDDNVDLKYSSNLRRSPRKHRPLSTPSSSTPRNKVASRLAFQDRKYSGNATNRDRKSKNN